MSRTFLIGENEQRIPMLKATEEQVKTLAREVVDKNGMATRVFQPEEIAHTYEQLEAKHKHGLTDATPKSGGN